MHNRTFMLIDHHQCSGVPVGDEMRALDQDRRTGAERRQRLFGFGDQMPNRVFALATPSALTMVDLPAAASLPVCLPTSAVSPSRSRRSSAI